MADPVIGLSRAGRRSVCNKKRGAGSQWENSSHWDAAMAEAMSSSGRARHADLRAPAGNRRPSRRITCAAADTARAKTPQTSRENGADDKTPQAVKARDTTPHP